MIDRQNISILFGRQNKSANIDHYLVADLGSEMKCSERTIQSYQAPLYLYPDEEAEQGDAFAATGRTVNFDPGIYAEICEAAGLEQPSVIASEARQSSASDGEVSGLPRPPDRVRGPRNDDDFRTLTGDARPTEVKVFDYIYGVLHSLEYRETYKELLKIDFPRIPYPKDATTFAHISEKGEALRRLHLMEGAAVGDTPYPYHGEGDDVVVKPELKDGKVCINSDQYFESVPELAWNFYIGGYQPAQKWLKDRKGRTLSRDDIGHYQKIIKILCETDRIMKEIELPLD